MGVGTRWLAMCRRKAHYATEAEAGSVVAEFRSQGDRAIGYFPCPYCGRGYVLGHPGPGKGVRRPRAKAPGRATWESLKRRGV